MKNLISLDNSFDSIDWDFASLSNQGLNSFHWYPATFVSAIPGSIIPILTDRGDIVFDTFCGTSTTGFEAVRLGRKFIGVDNNPIAILISKSKLLFPDTGALQKIFDKLISEPLITKRAKNKHPNESILRKWYHPKTYEELNYILSLIKDVENPTLRIPAQAVFSSILKKTCSQGKHWGWVCDNVMPKPQEIVYRNAIDTFSRALSNYCSYIEDTLDDIKLRDFDNRRKELRANWDIECGDTLSKIYCLPKNTVDLILTSPPYHAVADYVKAQRLSFLWFHKDVLPVEGYSFEDFADLRNKETGARSKRYTQSSFENYMSYMKKYLDGCHRVLKRNGYMVLIMGDSQIRKSTIEPLDEYAVQLGFEKAYEFHRKIRESRRRLMAKVPNEEIKVYIKR